MASQLPDLGSQKDFCYETDVAETKMLQAINAQQNRMGSGGDEGNRTPDLLLAKQALCLTELHPQARTSGVTRT